MVVSCKEVKDNIVGACQSRRSLCQLERPVENDSGTHCCGASPTTGPNGTGATGLHPVKLEQLMRTQGKVSALAGAGITSSQPPVADRVLCPVQQAGSSIDLQNVGGELLGSQCFSAGIIAGIGNDIINSARDLLKLIKTFVLADSRPSNPSCKVEIWYPGHGCNANVACYVCG